MTVFFYIADEEGKIRLRQALVKLLEFFEPLDTLKSKGFILPQSSEEWNKITELMHKVNSILSELKNGMNENSQLEANDVIKDYVNLSTAIEDDLKL